MKNIIVTGMLLTSMLTFTACNGGGGGGSSSKSSNRQLGEGSFSVTAGPTGLGSSCLNHSAGTLGSVNCEAIGGSHSSSSVSSCNGATGGGDMCDYGTPVTTCKIGNVTFSLEVAYSLETRDSCTMSGGKLVTACTGIAEGNCSSAGGTWESKNVNTCTGYDVETENNCILAGGDFYPNAEYLSGNMSSSGKGIISGDNTFYVSNIVDDGSSPKILSINSSLEIDYSVLTKVSDTAWQVSSAETHWRADNISMVPTKDFYANDYGDIYFNARSPISTFEHSEVNEYGDEKYTTNSYWQEGTIIFE